ncbi:PhnD/SsuA/transferrin family substrate-binding protein [Vibrio metschnikovii]
MGEPINIDFCLYARRRPAVYADVSKPFLDHMAKITGKRVQFFPVNSNAAQIEAMRSGRLHIAGFNTGSNPLAVACAFSSFCDDGQRRRCSYGYEMEIITYPTSGIEKIEDLRGRTLAFTAETLTSTVKRHKRYLKRVIN